MNSALAKIENEAMIPKGELATRNRKILLEYLSGNSSLEEIALRYGFATTELTSCISQAFEDIKSGEFHRDIRATLVQKVVTNIQKIETWMENLSPKYKKYHQQLTMAGEAVDLSEDADDHLAFVKMQGELRNQYAMLGKMLGAELPDEKDTAKESIQKKMLDALSTSLQIAKDAQDKNQRVQRTVIDVEVIDVPEENNKHLE